VWGFISPMIVHYKLTSIPADCSEYMQSCKAVRLWASGEVGAAYSLLCWEILLFFIFFAPPLSCPPGHPLLLQWWIKQQTLVCYICADSLCFKWSTRQARLHLQVACFVKHILVCRSTGSNGFWILWSIEKIPFLKWQKKLQFKNTKHYASFLEKHNCSPIIVHHFPSKLQI